MKHWSERAAAIDRMFEELATRIAKEKGVTHVGDTESGMEFRARVGGVVLEVVVEPELVDGQLWERLRVRALVNETHAAPRWDALLWCKRAFIGDERQAVVAIPKRTHAASPHWLSLWAPHEHDPLPTFSVDAPAPLVPI